jgi:microcystin-dependent protein
MAKNKISEFSSTAANNTDISNINIAEGCSPANVNNAIRSLMAQLKDQQDGTSGDPFTVAGTLSVTGGLTLDGSAGTSGQVLLSAGSGNTPTWGNTFVSGMIMMWSGTIASIPTGWLLCNGSSGTPDLRNRFIVGASVDNAGVANTAITGSNTQTGGSKDAIVVSHTHTATSTDSGHTHSVVQEGGRSGGAYQNGSNPQFRGESSATLTTASGTANITTTVASSGSSGTNANLVPYFALAFIMKS